MRKKVVRIEFTKEEYMDLVDLASALRPGEERAITKTVKELYELGKLSKVQQWLDLWAGLDKRHYNLLD